MTRHTPLPPAEAYGRFLSRARELPPERVQPCRAELPLARGNLMLGYQSVAPHFARLRKDLPTLPHGHLKELPDLLAAVEHAAMLAGAVEPLGRETFETRYARVRALREPLLLFAEVLVLLHILPDSRVKQIRAGTGPFDAGQDCLALYDLFREFAPALKHKSPFDDDRLEKTRQAGLELLAVTTPSGTRVAESPELVVALDARDRLWTLLSEGHGELRKAGYFLFGERVSEQVPLLASRLRTPAVPEPVTPGPTPEPTPEPTPPTP